MNKRDRAFALEALWKKHFGEELDPPETLTDVVNRLSWLRNMTFQDQKTVQGLARATLRGREEGLQIALEQIGKLMDAELKGGASESEYQAAPDV